MTFVSGQWGTEPSQNIYAGAGDGSCPRGTFCEQPRRSSEANSDIMTRYKFFTAEWQRKIEGVLFISTREWCQHACYVCSAPWCLVMRCTSAYGADRLEITKDGSTQYFHHSVFLHVTDSWGKHSPLSRRYGSTWLLVNNFNWRSLKRCFGVERLSQFCKVLFVFWGNTTNRTLQNWRRRSMPKDLLRDRPLKLFTKSSVEPYLRV